MAIGRLRRRLLGWWYRACPYRVVLLLAVLLAVVVHLQRVVT